jgi:hypothetical protein
MPNKVCTTLFIINYSVFTTSPPKKTPAEKIDGSHIVVYFFNCSLGAL